MAYRVIREKFNSIDDFMKAIQSRRNNAVMAREDSATSGSYSFTNTRTFNEAVKLIKEGYTEPLAQIKKAMAKHAFKTNAVVSRNRPSNNVMGYAPLVPNAILGLPNSMIYTEKQPMKAKAIKINYCSSVVSGVDTDTIINAGVAILNIINLLELSGYRVQLVAEPITSTSGKELASCEVVVKGFREQLDLKKLAFPLVHPSMQRRFGFRWLENHKDIKDNSWANGYGRSVSSNRYEEAKRIYTENGLLDDNSYLINVTVCRDENYDIEKIMERCGMSHILKGVL